ncbi:uncharacterized protein LOC583108 isoform X2 [Strongylocentrotus purpuratus]|uniref:NIDO domain-containing protein n=1 Tax=Strongylocentrotus purpuratus TaxID=7668 RepID=A0A7M7NQ55_STRPU|nr:uncharacterized protein LOC583108 isoform X2 [Strongylocentrotus purpuratus]
MLRVGQTVCLVFMHPTSLQGRIFDLLSLTYRSSMFSKVLLIGPFLLAITLWLTYGAEGSTLPEDFHPSAGMADLTSEEGEILTAFRQYLDSSLQKYQRQLHTTYTQNTLEYNRRKKRELRVNEDLSWDIQPEASFPTNISIIKYFSCEGDDYVIVGFNKVDEGIYEVDAEIYKYISGAFTPIGVTISTKGVTDIEPFLLEGETYIAVACGQFGPGDYEGLSQILTFDPSVPSVTHVQYILTYGVSALEVFIYEGDTYLGIANSRHDSLFRYMAPTSIYRFAGAHFDEVASVDTERASDIATAVIGLDLYVAISQYGSNGGGYTPGTLLYHMYVDTSTDEADVEMIKLQIMYSSAPKSVTFFVQEDHNYLAISNYLEVVDGAETTLTDSSIYWWATDKQFIEYQTISTDGAMHFEYLDMELDPNLLVTVDRTGLHFYEFTDNAQWEEADTDLYLYEPSTRLTDIHIEAFTVDGTDYIATSGGVFWTTEHRNLTESNCFSFTHVNHTTTYVTRVHLPSCLKKLSGSTEEGIENITSVSKTLKESGLSKTKDSQVINSNIVITGTVRLPILQTKTLEVQSGQPYEVDPELIRAIGNNGNNSRSLRAHPPSFVTKSTVQTIPGSITISARQTVVSGEAEADSFTSQDDLINDDIDLSYVDDNALRFTGSQTMTGQVDFTDDLTVGTAVTVSGDINSITVPDDVMDKGSSQTVGGLKTFDSNVDLDANVDINGDINGLDLNTDIVVSSRSASVDGAKTFSQEISLSQPMNVSPGKTVDTVDVSEFSSLVLSITSGGTLSGDVDFNSAVDITGDVSIDGSLINDVDFTSAYNDAVFHDTNQTITASKTFLNDLTSQDVVIVDGNVNGIDISESVFTLSGAQTIDSRLTIVDGGVEAQQDVILSGTVNGIDLSEEAVLIYVNQTITGMVIFTKDIMVYGDTIVAEGKTVDGVDLSEYAATAIKIIDEPQSMAGQKTFTNNVIVSGDITVSGDVNGVDVEDLYDDVLAKRREQTFEVTVEATSSIEFSGAVTLQSTIDGQTIPDDFVLLAQNGDIAGDKTFSDAVSISGDLTMANTKTINGEDLSAFDTNILKISGSQSLATGGITFNTGLSIDGDVTVTGTVNGYTIPDDLVLLAGAQTINSVDRMEDPFTGLFFPFGLNEGDEFLPANDDGYTDELPISVGFPFFDHIQTGLFVNNNGIISFSAAVSQFNSDSFPVANGKPIIAPFWADVDTRNGGTLSYRQVLRSAENDRIFLEADEIIRASFVDMRDFLSSWIFIATWDSVAHFSSSGELRNSFQAVMVTDGRYSFVIFNYGDINWAASGGGTPAQVGFNDGDGVNFYSVPGSRTAAVIDIATTSNIGVSGRWVFRTDDSNIEGLEGATSASLTVSTDCKTFTHPNIAVSGDINTPDLDVTGTVNTVDVDALYSDAVIAATGGACAISGSKTFPNFEVEGQTIVSGTVDGVNLTRLAATAVYLAGAQTIAGDKSFSAGTQIRGNVAVTNHVNSVDFAQKVSQVIYKDTEGQIRGQKTFSAGMAVTGDMDVDGLINGVNVTLLDQTYLSTQYEQTLDGKKTFTRSLALANLELASGKTLDTVDPSDFLLLDSNENLNNDVSFTKSVSIQGNIEVDGLINTVDIEELDEKTVRLSGGSQSVQGVKSFPSITVNNNIIIDPGLVDGVDVSDLSDRVLRSTVDNDISVRTVFEGAVTVSGNLLTEALTGGVNLINLFQDAVLLDEDVTIDGTVVYDSTAVTTMESVVFEDDLDVLVNLGQTTLEVLLTTAIRASTDQNITGNVVFDDDMVLQACLDIDGTTDLIDLSERAVLKSTEQTVSSCTRFGTGFRVDGDMSVGGTVDDVNLATLVSSRVTYSTDQQITGVWTFDDVTVSGNVTIDGTLNNIDVGDDLVTIYKNAVITGTKFFTADIAVITDLDTDEINDVDIVDLSNIVVLNEGTFSIDGEKTFQAPISIAANSDVTGLVNCVDVGLLDDKYEINAGDFYNVLSQLNDSMRTQCISASTMQTSIGEHPLLLTHWEDLQDIDNPATGRFHSITLEDGDTLLGLAETYNSAVDRCIGTQLYLCPANRMECFAILDTLLPAATDVHLYRYQGETFIVLLPSQQVGQCEEHSDEEVDTLTIVKLEDEAFSTSLTAPHASGATMFEIDGSLFLAVANYRDASTHNTDINSTVYVYDNAQGTFNFFQDIPTHGAFAVTHLSWKGITWLSFANNVLDYKSPIYVYDSQANQFVLDESRGTNHASHLSMFVIDDVPFIAISSEKLIEGEREVEFHREITILAFKDGQWKVMESLGSYGILDTAVFAIDNFVYLVGVSLEAGYLSIYEWHHAGMFELYQNIPFSNQYSAHAFVHNHEILMALARPAFTSIDIYSWKSKIMKAVIRGKTENTVLKAW